MSATLDSMKSVWEQNAKSSTDDLWASIIAMSTDPIDVADRIREAGQKNPDEFSIPEEVADEIDWIAANGADDESPKLAYRLTFPAGKQ